MATVRPLQSRVHQEFISLLVPDPANPPNLEVITGFVGDSAEPGHTRVYFDLQLADYVDIPDHSIRLIRQLPESVSPLGAAYVWFERVAEVMHGPIGGARRKAKFLEGRILDRRPIGQSLQSPDVSDTPVCETNDTGAACCSRPRTPQPGGRPGPDGDNTNDTGSSCCGGPGHTHDTSCQTTKPPKPQPPKPPK